MAVSPKYTRRLVVDGVVYRWKVRRRPSYDQIAYAGPLTAVAWREDAPAGPLHLTAAGPRPLVWLQPGVTLLPRQVAAAIRAAVAAGWDPADGQPFHLAVPLAGPPA